MRLATLIDTKALWNVALVSFLATVGAVTAYGTAMLAGDHLRAGRERGRAQAAVWLMLLGLAAAVCLGILVLGGWAMTQK